MQDRTEQQELIIRFLLGQLSEEEQSQVEQQFFSDNQYFEQVLAAEDTLLDGYLRNELSPRERERVEKSLLNCSYQLRDLEFNRRLVDDLLKRRDEKQAGLNKAPTGNIKNFLMMFLASQDTGSRFARVALIAGAAVIIFVAAVAVWNLILQSRLKSLEQTRATLEKTEQELRQRLSEQGSDNEDLIKQLEAEEQKRQQLEQEITDLRTSTPADSANEIALIALSKTSFSRGGGEIKPVRIRPAVRRIKFEIDTGAAGGSYDAAIRTFSGAAIWSRDSLRAQNKTGKIVLTLPAKLFPADDYILTLKEKRKDTQAGEEFDYSFRIRR